MEVRVVMSRPFRYTSIIMGYTSSATVEMHSDPYLGYLLKGSLPSDGTQQWGESKLQDESFPKLSPSHNETSLFATEWWFVYITHLHLFLLVLYGIKYTISNTLLHLLTVNITIAYKNHLILVYLWTHLKPHKNLQTLQQIHFGTVSSWPSIGRSIITLRSPSKSTPSSILHWRLFQHVPRKNKSRF